MIQEKNWRDLHRRTWFTNGPEIRTLKNYVHETYALSPRMRRANWMSLGMIVTLLAWIAHKLVSSKSPTKYASDASCNAKTAELWKRRSVLKSWAISLTNLWKGSLRMRSSVDFWYLRISRSATVPGLYRCGFFTPPVAGADFLAAFVASCFLGAFPPVDFRAVCLVRAMAEKKNSKKKTRTNSAIHKLRTTKGERIAKEEPNRRAPTIRKVYGRYTQLTTSICSTRDIYSPQALNRTPVSRH